MATREEQFHYINKGQEDELECHGFKRDKVKTSVTAVFALCTLGLLFLVFYWRPEWFVWAQFTSCAPGEADVVLLRTMDDYRTWSKERVNIETKGSMHHQISLLETRCDGDTHQLQDLPTLSVDSSPDKPIIQGGGQSDDQSSRYFIHHCLKYVWNAEKQTFEKVRGLDSGMPCSLFYTLRQGLSSPDQENRRSLYGDNAITVEVKPYIKLLFYQVLNPFYIFQLFSVCLWMSDEYYYYASAIIIMSLGSIGISLYTIRKQSEMLHQMVESHNTMLVKVCRDGEVCSEVTSTDLVPGDVLVIPANGMLLPCDAALITGNCIVNESMLTGESVPVTKTPVPPQSSDLYSPEVHQRHTLFCGTQVIQTRYYGGEKVKAVVVRTGFSTAKGELVRSILFPKPLNFKLLTAAYRFVSVLVGVAMIGFTFTVAWMALDGESVGEIFLEALDLITICVPPALPSALTIGIIYAQRRLKKQGIFCISPERINICGLLDMVCFDKTGTLTEDGLDLWAVVPTKNNSFAPAIQDVSQLPLGPFLTAMATTHSLTVIGGNLSGDPLDLKMFQATKWELEEPGSEESTKFDMLVPTVVRPPQTMVLLHSPDKREHPYEVGILRQFPFSSSLQRMSVMTRTLGSDHMVVYTKGAPEMIIQLCKPHTIPADFYEVLMTYTESGFRVIALACRPLENKVRFLQAQRMERNEVETDLTFLGLMVMQNALKPETTPIIHQLREANIRTVMVTGKVTTPIIYNIRTVMVTGKVTTPIIYNIRTVMVTGKVTTPIIYNIRTVMVTGKVTTPIIYNIRTVMVTGKVTTPIIYNIRTVMVTGKVTTPIIYNIRTVMVTGDNILTAVSVARECRMVCPGQQVVEVTALPPTDSTPPNITYTVSTKHMEPQEEIKGGEIAVQMEDTVDVDDSGDQFHFAVSGKSFAIIRKYFPHVLPKLAVGGTVFARMSPDQKTQLLEVYQDLGHYVGMCGDGANDCGALKRAHAGISLSELEASVASPFTSKKNDIQCVLTLIREGRCALVTSFGVFKFMALYSMIQFMSVLILYGVFANLGDTQYLYQDLVIITTIAFVMSRNSAYPKLVRQRPPTSLLRPPILFSVIVQIAIQLAFQLGAFYFLLAQPWFVPWEDYRLCNDGSMNVTVNTTDINATVGPTLKPCTVDYEDESDQGVWTYESATMFGIATFQYATLAFVFSKGKPFRQPVHTNWLYMLDLIILTALNVWLLLYPTEPVAYFMELSQFPDFTFRLWLLVGAAANFVISWLTEVLLADNNALWKWLTSSYHKHHKKKYQILREELLYDKDYGLPVGVIRPQGTGKEINSNVGHVGGTRSGSIDESDDMENSTYL
ncbi:PREDICTED: probable cation-transporting ATPase 13A3 isoform X2 [Branchiostoma belcheri]|uniref:Cation-transporting ATPase n=1 Tax=Branchiostoma belcheri TaxID=7741 RepID=A0A6P4Y8G6_BRABE|nr:PREDICTED: probable cation-transporting ATPase 13A3 isoform X2 [Branchiostoma belcheri]